MAALKTLWSGLALLFQLIFTILLAVLGGLSLAGGATRLHLEMLPWTGATLEWVLLGSGIFGLLTVILAAAGKHRYLFFLWSLAAAVVLTKFMIFSSYTFPPETWKPAVWMLAGLWFSALGAFFLMRALPAPGPRKYRVK